MIKSFSGNYRTIAPDHIGCGLSDKPSLEKFPYMLKNHIDNLEALIDSLNLDKKITMIVHDWGGAIGMGYATRHPEKIKRIVILNTAAFRLPHNCPFPWPIWAFRHTEIGAWLNTNCNAFSWIASHTCSIKGMTKKVKKGFTAPYDCPENRIATTRFVQDIPLIESDPSYSELIRVEEGLKKLQNIPAIVCFGRKDFCFNRYFYDAWKTHLPKAKFYSFHAGHYLLEDVGTEVFSLMKEFFQTNP
jgi:haloalkane dehalogenase